MSIHVLLQRKDKKTKEDIIYFNPTKRFVAPRWYIPNAQGSGLAGANPSMIVLPANQTSGNIPIEFDEGNGHAEIFGIVSESTGSYEITIIDQGRKHSWMNRPIQIDTIAGSAQRPFILPVTYFLNVEKGTRQLSVIVTDLSGNQNTIRLALVGRAFFIKQAPQDVRQAITRKFGIKERVLTYMLTTAQAQMAIATATQTRVEFIVPSDYPMELMKMTASSIDTTTGLAAPFEFEMIDYSSGRRYSQENLRIHSNLGWGNAQYPYIPFESFFLPRNYRLMMDYWSLAPNDANFYFTLTGSKVLIPKEQA